MEPLLRVIDLHKSFGANEVLKGVNLEVNAGETITIIGPSGSGKTTLLRCINYLERPTSGHVYIEDRLIGETWDGKQFRGVGDRELAKERTEMGMVFQRFNLWPHLSALDNVTLGPIRVLKKSTQEARTMLVVTHEMRFAQDAADRVIFMDDVVIVEEGPPRQLFVEPQHARTR